MIFRTTGATLLIGLLAPCGHALAQYAPPPYPPPSQVYPAPPLYPAPQAYPAPRNYPGYRMPAPADMDEDDDDTPSSAPVIQGRPLPPAAIGPQSYEPPPPPGARWRRAPAQVEEVEVPPPAGSINRDAALPPGLVPKPVYPPRQAYPPQQAYPQAMPPPSGAQDSYDPAAADTRPYHQGHPGLVPGEQQDALRPPMPISPGQGEPAASGVVRGDPHTHMAALPPEVRPETGPRKELPLQFRRSMVDYRTKEPVGTLIIDTQNTYLYLVMAGGKAMRYGVGVGREGFTWAGTEKVTRMADWPDWNPPSEMIERQPYLPRFMAGGDGNPLGARALYLGKTIYRIHGTNQPSTIGTFVSSGCIRLTNEDVTDLYSRVKVGTRVVVLPGRPPAAAAISLAPPGAAAAPVGAPPVSMAPPAPPPVAVAR